MSKVTDWEIGYAKSILARAQKERKSFLQTYVRLLAAFVQYQPKGELALNSSDDGDLQIRFWNKELQSVDIYTFSSDAVIEMQVDTLIKYFQGKSIDREKLDSIRLNPSC